MVITNNQDTRISMSELNRNIKDTVREFEKIVTGQNINYSSDDAAKYSTSEKMRTKLRALEQSQQNTKSGMIMLTMAQEGIQEQLDILKMIKFRALQAADASSSDEDRIWIQKEIADGFLQIDNIAYDIEHNGINLLTGNVPIHQTETGWKLLLTPKLMEDSDMNIIDDGYFQLDAFDTPFDAFSSHQSIETSSRALLGGKSSVSLSGGTDGSSAQFKMDFTDKSTDDLVGKAFQVRGVNERGATSTSYYAIIDSSDNDTRYNTRGFNVVDIADMDKGSALDAIAAKVNKVQKDYINAQANDDSIIFTPVNKQSESDNAKILNAASVRTTTGGVDSREGANATGLGLGGLKTSGGTAAVTHMVHHEAYTDDQDMYHAAWDEKVVDTSATYATLSFNVSEAADDSGIYFNGKYIKFITDPNDPNYSSTTTGDGVTKIGLGYKGTISAGLFNMAFNNGQVNITAKNSGMAYNDISIIDGYEKRDAVAATVTGVGLSGLNAETTQIVKGVDGQRASYDMDLTAYNTTNINVMENFIDELLTGSLHLNYKQYAYSSEQSIAYEFIDTKNPNSMEAKQRLNGSQTIDLNNLRTAVEGGTTIADAFINLMTRQSSHITDASDNGKKILRVTSSAKGVFGNEDSLNTTADRLSQYTLNFRQWLNENSLTALKDLPHYLDGKGFRFYCATDTERWFNFVFTSGEDESERPDGISGADFDTISIDLSNLKPEAIAGLTFDEIVERMVETIYEQASPHLATNDDHSLCLAMNPEEGTITIYDDRKENLLLKNTRNLLTARGVNDPVAKIADGVVDDVQKAQITVAANQRQLAIQHTDYSSQSILLHIPQTTMNHIFTFDPDLTDESIFNITTQRGRDYLLGKKNSGNSSSAALNKALEFLFSALTTVSAQNAMLRYTESNLFAEYDNEKEAESKIRDADIAKAYVNYTKANMIAGASETILAQANQNMVKVLELLDRSKPADKKSADNRVADKKSADNKAGEKKSTFFGQIDGFATQRNRTINKSTDKSTDKNFSAQKSSTDKKVDTVAKKIPDKK